jgi:hypothetical protein
LRPAVAGHPPRLLQIVTITTAAIAAATLVDDGDCEFKAGSSSEESAATSDAEYFIRTRVPIVAQIDDPDPASGCCFMLLGAYCAVVPPSITSPAPVTKAASSETKNTMPLAISLGVPMRPIGSRSMTCRRAASISAPRAWSC